MMIQDNVLFIGMKEIKSVIIVFSGYGKKISVINVRKLTSLTFDRWQKSLLHRKRN